MTHLTSAWTPEDTNKMMGLSDKKRNSDSHSDGVKLDIPFVKKLGGVLYLNTSILEATAPCWYEFDSRPIVNPIFCPYVNNHNP